MCWRWPARMGRPPPAACWRGFWNTPALTPGFLIGGVPSNFDATARLGSASYFVIEADEYDTAFFDKRAKFVHYRPRTAILNNLEYDHADIYPDVAVDPPPIQSAAAHGARGRAPHRQRRRRGASRHARHGMLDAAGDFRRGRRRRGRRRSAERAGADWTARDEAGESARFSVHFEGREVAVVEWDLLGKHNVLNALGGNRGRSPRRHRARARGAGPCQISRSQAAHGDSRRRRRRDGLRRFRASPHRHRNHARGTAGTGRAGANRGGARAAIQHHEARRASRAAGAVAHAGRPLVVPEFLGSGLGPAGRGPSARRTRGVLPIPSTHWSRDWPTMRNPGIMCS